MREIRVHMGTFDYTIVCVINNDKKKLLRYFRWKFEDKNFYCDFESRGICFHRRNFVPIIWLPRKPKTPREHATLAHEVFHAVCHLMRWTQSLALTEETEEVYAHAIGHVVNSILEKA